MAIKDEIDDKKSTGSRAAPGFAFDREVGLALTALLQNMPAPARPERGDWQTLRKLGNASMEYWAKLSYQYNDVHRNTFFTKSKDGTIVELRWYSKVGTVTGSAVVYAHGGGMVLGDLNKYDCVIDQYVHFTDVPFLSVGYRLAPEAQHTKLAEDVFAGLIWLINHTEELEVDINRIAIMGDSAGGGIAAGAAILARDQKIRLARQILIYPMLDDRNLQPDEYLLPFLTWNYDSNYTGWSALLGEDLGTDRVSPIAAPARLTDFTGLASAFIEVGELDIFRDENIAYAQNLVKAAVPAELHVLPGAPHGYERFAPGSALAVRAMKDRYRVIKSI